MKKPSSSTIMERFRKHLSQPVDGASVAIFRIAFGIVLVWSMLKLVSKQGNFSALEVFYRDAAWTFPYPGFEAIQPWSEPWLSLHVAVIALAGIALILGIFHRTAAFVAFVGYSCIFLWEQSTYNNHYYLICLFAFLLIWIPADRRFSLRNYLPWEKHSPEVSSSQIPFWSVLILRSQLFIVYFFGGIAKLESDWLSGEPLYGPGEKIRNFLIETLGFPEAILIIHICLFMAWVGVVFDLSIGFLLSIPRTRIFGLCLTGIFHGINHFVLPIGVFPFMAFTTTLIFLPADWPLQLASWVRQPRMIWPDRKWFWRGGLAFPLVGCALGWRCATKEDAKGILAGVRHPATALVTTGFLAWIAIQTLVPLRHFAIAGNASWTEEGQYFAWRMMLRQKAASFITFHVDDKAAVDRRDGASKILWDAYPEDVPRIVYASIDCRRFPWQQNPGLQFVFEPGLGYRVLYIPRANESDAVDAELQKVSEFFAQRLQDQPELTRTRPPLEVLKSAQQRMGAIEQLSEKNELAFRHSIGAAIEAFQLDAPTEMQRERRQAMLVDLIDFIQSTPISKQLRSELNAIAPFELQGAESTDGDVYSLASYLDSEEAYAALARLRTSDSSLVWVDFSRLRPRNWKKLPLRLVTFENGRLPLLWNYFHELNSRQIDSMGSRPVMIQQYANRIADIWQNQTGRRPRVNAYAYIMMNYRFPQLLVDPEVDLATAQYHPFRHNEWIIPHTTERIGLSDQERSGQLH